MSFTAYNEFGDRIKKGHQIGMHEKAVTFDSVISLSKVTVIDRNSNKVTMDTKSLKVTVR